MTAARGCVKRVSMMVWNTFRHDARVLNEAETLARNGYHVMIHALALPGVTPGTETVGTGIEVRRIGGCQGARQARTAQQRAREGRWGGYLRALGSLGSQFRMIWNVWRARPHVVHAHDVNMLPAAWIAILLLRVPLVYDAHEISTHREGYRHLRRLVGSVEAFIMPRASGTVTTTEARARFFARAYGIPRPLVLQNRPRAQQVARSSLLREELELRQPWPIVIYQGGQQPGRGLERLIEAIARVEGAYLVFVGGGSIHEDLRAMVNRMALGERVHFVPTVLLAELPGYTASADIGVQPIENTCLNHFTTDSNKLFEYVQAGLPVIASDLPEIRRVVRGYDLGLLVPAGDAEALANAIVRLVKENPLRLHYAQQARRAAAALSWEAQEDELLTLYERVLSEHG